MKPRPAFDLIDEEEEAPDGWRPAMPSPCLRVFSSPHPQECPMDCVGRQYDETCLADVVREANEAGVKWVFELDRDGRWIYSGELL